MHSCSPLFDVVIIIIRSVRIKFSCAVTHPTNRLQTPRCRLFSTAAGIPSYELIGRALSLSLPPPPPRPPRPLATAFRLGSSRCPRASPPAHPSSINNRGSYAPPETRPRRVSLPLFPRHYSIVFDIVTRPTCSARCLFFYDNNCLKGISVLRSYAFRIRTVYLLRRASSLVGGLLTLSSRFRLVSEPVGQRLISRRESRESKRSASFRETGALCPSDSRHYHPSRTIL